MNLPIKTTVETAKKAVATGYHAVAREAKEAVKSVKYLAGDNSAMPERVKKYREARGFRKY